MALVSERKKGIKMKKLINLATVKEVMKNDRCYETDNSFIVNDYGKYTSGISFVLDKYFQLDGKGNPINPVMYQSSVNIVNNINIDFSGNSELLFGKFWRSSKDTPMFKICDPLEAEEMLIRVDWGGAFNSSRGYDEKVVDDVKGHLYFKKAASHGGGTGYDYWVFPVGYSRTLSDDLESSDYTINSIVDDLKVCKEVLDGIKNNFDSEYDKLLENRRISVEKRHTILPKLFELSVKLKELKESNKYDDINVASCFEFGLDSFKFNAFWSEEFYNEESLKKVEEYYNGKVESIRKADEKLKELENIKAEFEKFRPRMDKCGITMTFGDNEVSVEYDLSSFYDNISRHISHIYDYSEDSVQLLQNSFDSMEEDVYLSNRYINNNMRIANALESTELPEELYPIFRNSEEISADIIKTAEAIIKASKSEKTEMEIHDLQNCGHSRRCQGIFSIVGRMGVDCSDTLNLESEVVSIRLADYILTGKVE